MKKTESTKKRKKSKYEFTIRFDGKLEKGEDGDYYFVFDSNGKVARPNKRRSINI
jgi:hypothetical protein